MAVPTESGTTPSTARTIVDSADGFHHSQPAARGGGGGPRACRTCAIAKAKCIPSKVHRSKCERCLRLKKECALQESKARRKRTVISRRTRVAQLEEKLDDIVNLLKSSHDAEVQDQTEDETMDTSPLRNPSTGTSTKTCSAPAAMNGNTVNRKRYTLPFRDDDESTSSQPTSKPTGQEDVYLQVYRSHMSRYFPFVMIPDTISAEELAQSKPFLLEVIQVAASYKEQGRQALRGKEVLDYLIRRLLFASEKSMDLLQGLLVYICWYRNIFYTGRQLTNLYQMAIALMADLGLNRPSMAYRYKPVQDVIWTVIQGILYTPTGTLDERRTFLGCFYLSSLICTSVKGLDPLPYTTYVEECCRVLAEAKEFPSDQYVVELIRTHTIVNEIFQYIPSAYCATNTTHVAANRQIASIQERLDSAKQSWVENISNKNLLLVHHHYAEILLYEYPVYDILNRPISGRWENGRAVQCVEFIHAASEASRATMNAFLTLNPEDLIHLNMMFWLHVGRAAISMRKMCFLTEIPGLDVSLVRARLDLPGVLDKIIAMATMASAAMKKGGGQPQQHQQQQQQQQQRLSQSRSQGLCTTTAAAANEGGEGTEVGPDDKYFTYICDKNDMLVELAARMSRVKSGYLEAIRLEKTGMIPDQTAQAPIHQLSIPATPSSQAQQVFPGQQTPFPPELWNPGVGDTLLTTDEDFWQMFWQEWQTG